MKNIFSMTADDVQECQTVFMPHPLSSDIEDWVKTLLFQWQNSH